ncbi:DNA-processing protein DprA [Actinocatenispora comari]|uniref:DNA-processing protein DprA n=1 Tax=Actinocatenispora comari TaxID=2807577 RepID=UPI001CEC51F4|nr:DNA-processing protein DprA [Actinocatenispora comari]
MDRSVQLHLPATGTRTPWLDPVGARLARAAETIGWQQHRLARVALCWLVEPGHRPLGALVRELGPVEVLRRLYTGAVPGRVSAAAAARLAAGDPVQRALQLAREGERLGCRVVVPEDDEWPVQVEDLVRIGRDADPRADPHTDPPILFWARGGRRIDEAAHRAVAVVGARAATDYGTHVTAELAFGLADRGWTVVSGGAYGVDAAAHRGALAASGLTVAVQACGLDISYPMANAGLLERIGQDGLLLSEWPPGAGAQRHRFLIRNRVIAALCRGTVVVEASARSGTRNTARRARELGRIVLAVPGPITSGMSVGTNLMIRQDEARLVSTAAEVIEEVGRIGDDLAPIPQGARTARDDLDAVSTTVLDAVPLRRAATVEEIAVAAGVSAQQVRRTVPLLSMLGFVEETDGGYRLRPEEKPSGSPGERPSIRG